jgi:hypothetical protein
VVHVEDGMSEPSSGEQQRSVSVRATGRGYAERAERAEPAELPVDRVAGLPAGARGGVDSGRDREPGACARETRSPRSTSHPCDRWCGRHESNGRSNDVARSDAQSGSATYRHVDRSMTRAVERCPRHGMCGGRDVGWLSAGAARTQSHHLRDRFPRTPYCRSPQR